MMDPTSAESTRPLDPPNLQRFRQYTPDDRSTPPQNTLSNRLTKLTFPAFDGTEFRDWICRCEQFFDSLKLLWQTDPHLSKLIMELKTNKLSHPQYTYANDELRRKGKLVVGNNVEIKTHIFKWLHDSAVGGHSGRDATLHRIKSLFFWPKMSLEVQNYVRNCSVCQKNKYENVAKPGLLHPLPVPQGVWESISMDFIEGLPPSSGKHCILVVIDKLSKNAHFIALSHPYTAIEVAQAYLDNIFKLQGLPKDIVSDRDPTFLSEVWKELFRVHGVDL